MIALIDYGAGNLHSVQHALDYIGCESCITSDAKVLMEADAAILPGVGYGVLTKCKFGTAGFGFYSQWETIFRNLSWTSVVI